MHKFLVMALMGLTAAAQTQIDLATQTKRVDFSQASSTKPLQTGSSLPAACAVGQMFFNTGAPAGANLYACTATNTWSPQGGIAAATADQLSGPFFCQDAGISGSYSCSLAPAISAYTPGTTYWFRANTANSGGAALNLNGLGPKTIVKQENQPLAANDIRAGQWVMVTYDGTNLQMQSQTGNSPSGSVSTVFGRTGAVTAQTGDYTYSQIGGSVSAAQLPTTAMQTGQSNTVTAGTQDFTQAAHTLPSKSGTTAARPSTCSVGESYFATDAAAGQNLLGCTATNVWSQQAGGGGSSAVAVQASGTTVGSRNTINIIPGTGIAPLVTDTGTQIDIQLPIDTAVMQTRVNDAQGADQTVMDTGANGTAFMGCPAGITPSLATNMAVRFVPAHNSTGGASTLNYCATSAVSLKEADGATNLTSGDLVAGRQQDIWYDGTVWRLKVPASGGASGGTPTFPDVKYSPAANCANSGAGNGWSSATAASCKGGSNNQGGYISLAASATAQFTIPVPNDWAGGSNYPYLRFYVSSGDATNGHTIVPQIQVSCLKGDGSTTDDVTFAAVHSAGTVTLNGNANRLWSSSTLQMNSTDFSGCVAGSLMIVQVGRAADTATSAYFYGASVTFPRTLTMEAN